MPTRFIKESACTSPNLARLSHGAERCFWRLVTKADDYGRFDANPLVIAGTCFPLIPQVTENDTRLWLEEMVKASLIKLYRSNDRRFGTFLGWDRHQVKRASKSKFPPPPTVVRSRKQMLASVSENKQPQANASVFGSNRIRSSYSDNRIRSSEANGPQPIGVILEQHKDQIIKAQ